MSKLLDGSGSLCYTMLRVFELNVKNPALAKQKNSSKGFLWRTTLCHYWSFDCNFWVCSSLQPVRSSYQKQQKHLAAAAQHVLELILTWDQAVRPILWSP